MSDPQIIRPQLAFEREFGQHRNWWVRDPRICGNPLSIYLFLLSHEVGRPVTQTEARTALEIGERAWVSGKKALLQAGFLLEVRDRFPDDHPRGRQRRFRLFLQDPEPGLVRSLDDAVIELEEPFEEWLKQEKTPDSAKCSVEEKALVTSTLQNAESEPSTLHFAESLEEEKTKPSWSVGYISPSNQPTTPAADARVAEIDVALAGLHPDLRLTYAQIEREVSGRVDLGSIDVERAVLDTVIRAAERGQKVENPARYVASVIVRNPRNWPVGAAAPAPFDPVGGGTSEFDAPSCARGDHWWGSERLPELDRAHCERCGTARRTVDPTFAALEDELSSIGGEF